MQKPFICLRQRDLVLTSMAFQPLSETLAAAFLDRNGRFESSHGAALRVWYRRALVFRAHLYRCSSVHFQRGDWNRADVTRPAIHALSRSAGFDKRSPYPIMCQS